MRQLRISRQAYADLDAIAEFIQRDNPLRAQSFTEEISEKIQQVAERPLSFPARSDLRPGMRAALHGSYLILFRVDDEIVQIVRVIHGARDIPNLL